jgi:hypothetical protein
VFLLLLSSCRASGLVFREDDRVDITEPNEREKVALPITLRWETRGLELGRPGGPSSFAVFVDREPMQPGQSLRSIGDDVCKRTPGCPDESYLRDRYIFLTEKTSLVLDAVPDNRSDAERAGSEDGHDVTIVLLDEDDRRVGEAAYRREFTLERDE